MGGWTIRQVVHHVPDSQLLRALSGQQFQRTFVHPELGSVALFEALAMYAWHGRHHAAHIRNAISR
jgi:hypothetical protein